MKPGQKELFERVKDTLGESKSGTFTFLMRDYCERHGILEQDFRLQMLRMSDKTMFFSMADSKRLKELSM